MKPILEKIPSGHFSFFVKQLNVPFLDYPWHYHPEYELTLIEQGRGTRFVGNHIERFGENDIILLGPNLPHVWKNDEEYHLENKNVKVKCIVIHFAEHCFGKDFFHLPEMENIRRLLEKSQRGLKITGRTKNAVIPKIQQLFKEKGTGRILMLIDILEKLATSKEIVQLSSPGFCNTYNDTDNKRLSVIYNYVLNNYHRNISLKEAASAIHMNPTSFCRYFKSRTRKTFTQLVNEIRIGQACRMITENDLSISQACYESGYTNLSYFNRQFRKYTGMNAKKYRNAY